MHVNSLKLLNQKPFKLKSEQQCYGNHSIIVQTLACVLKSKLWEVIFFLCFFPLKSSELWISSILPWHYMYFYISLYGTHQKLFIAFFFFHFRSMVGIKWIIYNAKESVSVHIVRIAYCLVFDLIKFPIFSQYSTTIITASKSIISKSIKHQTSTMSLLTSAENEEIEIPEYVWSDANQYCDCVYCCTKHWTIGILIKSKPDPQWIFCSIIIYHYFIRQTNTIRT